MLAPGEAAAEGASAQRLRDKPAEERRQRPSFYERLQALEIPKLSGRWGSPRNVNAGVSCLQMPKSTMSNVEATMPIG